MRWLLALCVSLAVLGCEDDPDDLAHLRDAGTAAAAEDPADDPAEPPAPSGDEDAGS